MRMTVVSAYTAPPAVPKMPEGLVELMEGLTREVLKQNPPDVYEFCAAHMETLLQIRDGRPLHKPLSLDKKIARAQEKVRKRAELRNKEYKPEIPKDNAEEQFDHDEIADQQKTENIDQTKSTVTENPLKVPFPHLLNVTNDSEVEIFHEPANEEAVTDYDNIPPNNDTVVLESSDIQESVNVEAVQPDPDKSIEDIQEVEISKTLPTQDKNEELNNKSEDHEENNVESTEGNENKQSSGECNSADFKSCTQIVSPVIAEDNKEIHEIDNVKIPETEIKTCVPDVIDISETLKLPVADSIESFHNLDTSTNLERASEDPNAVINQGPETISSLLIDPIQDCCDPESVTNNDTVTSIPPDQPITQKSVETEELTELANNVISTDIKNDESKIQPNQEPAVAIKDSNIDFDDNPEQSEQKVWSGEKDDLNTNNEIIDTTSLANPINGVDSKETKIIILQVPSLDVTMDGNPTQETEVSELPVEVGFEDKTIILTASNNENEAVGDLEAPFRSVIAYHCKIEECDEKTALSSPIEVLTEDTESESINLEEHESRNTSELLNEADIINNVQQAAEMSSGKVSTIDEYSVEDSSNTDSALASDKTKTIEDNTESKSQNSNMDLETAAVTIQKVFRTFMFKSRASTFEDITHEDHSSLEEDNDKEEGNEFPVPSNNLINKERRTLGLNRMDTVTVLQTVNEEKSLSLSTDDSSTLSSAATIIQAHVRGFLVRNKLISNKTASTSSLVNSDGPSTSLEGDPEQKNKTVLNIHIVPEGIISRDESLLTSTDLSLDGSPPSSTNLHPMGYDVIERRKQLKREDAIQSISPPSNNSGKLSEDVDSVKEISENGNDSNKIESPLLKTDALHDAVTSSDTTPTKSITVETVVEAHNLRDITGSPEQSPEADATAKRRQAHTKMSSDEMDVITPRATSTSEEDKSVDSQATSQLLHSGEFHDVLLPTQLSRGDAPVVSEFKNVLAYFLIWNNA